MRGRFYGSVRGKGPCSTTLCAPEGFGPPTPPRLPTPPGTPVGPGIEQPP